MAFFAPIFPLIVSVGSVVASITLWAKANRRISEISGRLDSMIPGHPRRPNTPPVEETNIKVALASDRDRLDLLTSRVSSVEAKQSNMATHDQRISLLAQRLAEMHDHSSRIFQTETDCRTTSETMRAVQKMLSDMTAEIQDLRLSRDSQAQRLSCLEVQQPHLTFFNDK